MGYAIYPTPTDLHLEGPSFLACPDDDYDISTAIPRNRDSDRVSRSLHLPAFIRSRGQRFGRGARSGKWTLAFKVSRFHQSATCRRTYCRLPMNDKGFAAAAMA